MLSRVIGREPLARGTNTNKKVRFVNEICGKNDSQTHTVMVVEVVARRPAPRGSR